MASKANFKVWKSSPDALAGVMVTHDSVIVAGSKTRFIAVNKEGTTISGPVSFATTSENIRQGGLFSQTPDFVRMIPQTIVTPYPSQVPFPPVAFALGILAALPLMLALTES